jgi:hypothetical protein
MDTDKHRRILNFAIQVAMLVAVLWCSGCGGSCSNSILNEATSPDGKYVATAFIRDCGATADFSPQVCLRPVGQKLADTGNVFIGNHSDKIQISWLSNTQLVIRTDAITIQQATNFQLIQISLQSLIQ